MASQVPHRSGTAGQPRVVPIWYKIDGIESVIYGDDTLAAQLPMY